MYMLIKKYLNKHVKVWKKKKMEALGMFCMNTDFP